MLNNRMTAGNNLESKGGSLIGSVFPYIHWETLRNQEKAMSWTTVNINE
jgi:hypothetical protein